MAGERITSLQVAQRAGVSQSAVSRQIRALVFDQYGTIVDMQKLP